MAGCAKEPSLPGWLADTQPPPPAEAGPAGEPVEPGALPGAPERAGITQETVGREQEMAALAAPPTTREDRRITVFEAGAVKIGFLVPLTGRGHAEGQALLDAAQLALFEVGGNELVLLPRDTGGTPEGAVRAAQEVIDAGARLILGPLFNEQVGAVAPLARQAGINVVAFSTDPRVAGDGVYLIGFTSRQQVERIVDFAQAQGAVRFAALAPDDAYGRMVVEQYRRAVEARGAMLTRVAFYAPDGGDASGVVRRLADYDRRHQALEAQKRALAERGDELAREALRRLQGLDTIGEVAFDALLLADGGQELGEVAALLSYFDIDPTKVRLLGTGLWDDPVTLTEPSLAGGWFVSTSPEARGDFEHSFAASYGRAPLRLATLAYDAMALAAVLARRPAGPDFGADMLAMRSGFIGVDGIFRFAPDGIAERGLAVLEVKRGGEVAVLSEAPRGFRVTSP